VAGSPQGVPKPTKIARTNGNVRAVRNSITMNLGFFTNACRRCHKIFQKRNLRVQNSNLGIAADRCRVWRLLNRSLEVSRRNRKSKCASVRNSGMTPVASCDDSLPSALSIAERVAACFNRLASRNKAARRSLVTWRPCRDIRTGGVRQRCPNTIAARVCERYHQSGVNFCA